MHFALNAVQYAAAQRKTGDQIAHFQNGLTRHHGVLLALILLLLRRLERNQGETARQIAAVHRPQARNRRQQRFGVRMHGRVKNLLNRTGFHRAALVHHQHPIGDIGDHAHIVGDKNHPHLHLLLQHFDELQDLRLNRHVQRRRRLVGNQHRRTAGERHGNHHALAHAAGKLMRVATQNGLRLRNAHQLQHPSGLAERFIAAQPLMQADGLGDLFPDRENRVQGGHRLLEDHRNIRPAHALHLRTAQLI